MRNPYFYEAIDAVQNHTTKEVSSTHYVRYDFSKEKAATMNAWNGVLSQIIGG